NRVRIRVDPPWDGCPACFPRAGLIRGAVPARSEFVRKITQRGQITTQALIEVAHNVLVCPFSHATRPSGAHNNYSSSLTVCMAVETFLCCSRVPASAAAALAVAVPGQRTIISA